RRQFETVTGRIAEVQRVAALRPDNLRLDGHTRFVQAPPPRRDLVFAHGERGVTRPVRAVRRNRLAADAARHRRRLWIEQEQHAAPRAKKDVALRLSLDQREAQYVAVKTLRSVEVIDLERGFED